MHNPTVPWPPPSPTPTDPEVTFECPHNARFAFNPNVDIPQKHLTAMKILFGCHCQDNYAQISQEDCSHVADYLATIFHPLNLQFDTEYDGSLGSGPENGQLMPPHMTLHPDVTQQLLWPRNQIPAFPYREGGQRHALGHAEDLAGWWDAQKVMVSYPEGRRKYRLNHLEEASLQLVYDKLFIKLTTLNRFPGVAEHIGEELKDAPCACFHVYNIQHLSLPCFLLHPNPANTPHTLSGYGSYGFDLKLFKGQSFHNMQELRYHILPLQIWAHCIDLQANILGTWLRGYGLPKFDPCQVGASKIVRQLQRKYIKTKGGCNSLIPHDYDWGDQ